MEYIEQKKERKMKMRDRDREREGGAVCERESERSQSVM